MDRFFRKRSGKDFHSNQSTVVSEHGVLHSQKYKNSEEEKQEDEYNTRVIVKDYFESTTTHGLHRIYASTKFIKKTFWILVFIVVFVLLLNSLTRLFLKLFKYGIVVEIRSRPKTQMEFPAVTICNLNPFRGSQMKGYIPNNMKEIISSKKLSFESLLLYFSYLSKLNNSQLYQAGYSGEEFFIQRQRQNQTLCTFGSRLCFYPRDFKVMSTTHAGNCYTFNINGSVKQIRPGPFYGLRLGLNINQKEYDTIMPWMWNFGSAGAEVMIHNPNDVPISQGFYVAPGTLSSIAISKKRITRLRYPFPDKCQSLEETKQNFLFSTRYTLELCLKSCYITEQFKFCGYVNPLAYASAKQLKFHANVQYTVATNVNQIHCLFEFDAKYDNGEISCNCPVPCEEEKFDMHISQAVWPSHYLANQLLSDLKNESGKEYAKYKNWNINDIYSNILAIQVYFNDFTVEEITQKRAYDWNSLSSDIGGQLGLWIGASVFSYLEFGTFLLALLTYKCCKVKKMPLNDVQTCQLTSFSCNKDEETVTEAANKILLPVGNCDKPIHSHDQQGINEENCYPKHTNVTDDYSGTIQVATLV